MDKLNITRAKVDKVKIIKTSENENTREEAFISINGVELKTCVNYKIEKNYNERAKVIIELDADVEIINCGDMFPEQIRKFLINREADKIANEIKANAKPKGIKIDKYPGFKNCLLADNNYDLCKNKETGEIYFFKFEQDADPVRFRLISLSNIFDEQYVTIEHFRKNYRTISYDTTRIHY